MSVFREGDDVRAKYMSDEKIVGVVVAVSPDGKDVRVRYPWDTVVHHHAALQVLRGVEAKFIPDDRFAAEVRRSRTANPHTVCSSTSSVEISGGRTDDDRTGAAITVWRWEADGDRPNQREVSKLAKQSRYGRAEKLSRLHVEVFRSEHGAGVASRTVYQVVPA